jgi:hypothetical protein
MARLVDRLTLFLASNNRSEVTPSPSRRAAMRAITGMAAAVASVLFGLKSADAVNCCEEPTPGWTECRCGFTGAGYQCWVFKCNYYGDSRYGCYGRACGKRCVQLYQVARC